MEPVQARDKGVGRMTDARKFSDGYDRLSRAAKRLAADRRPAVQGDPNGGSPSASAPGMSGSGRASDAEREAVAERVRSAVADGRLGLDELDARLTAVYSARTRAALDAAVADLPPGPDVDPGRLELRTTSGTRRKAGYWVVPSRIVAECSSGSITLDFTAAVCHHPEVEVHATAKSGTIRLIVPHGWGVDMDNVASGSGSITNKVLGRPDPGAPMLRVKGEVRSGSVVARHPRRTFRQWLTRTPVPGSPGSS